MPRLPSTLPQAAPQCRPSNLRRAGSQGKPFEHAAGMLSGQRGAGLVW